MEATVVESSGTKWSFIVPGHPVPKARMTQRTKWGRREQASLAYQRSVAEYAQLACPIGIVEPVRLTVRFYVRGGHRGDLANLIKAVEDGLQYGKVIVNDRQIVQYGDGTGVYRCDRERAEVTIELMGGRMRDGREGP